MQGAGCRCRGQGAGCRVQRAGCRGHGAWRARVSLFDVVPLPRGRLSPAHCPPKLGNQWCRAQPGEVASGGSCHSCDQRTEQSASWDAAGAEWVTSPGFRSDLLLKARRDPQVVASAAPSSGGPMSRCGPPPKGAAESRGRSNAYNGPVSAPCTMHSALCPCYLSRPGSCCLPSRRPP